MQSARTIRKITKPLFGNNRRAWGIPRVRKFYRVIPLEERSLLSACPSSAQLDAQITRNNAEFNAARTLGTAQNEASLTKGRKVFFDSLNAQKDELSSELTTIRDKALAESLATANQEATNYINSASAAADANQATRDAQNNANNASQEADTDCTNEIDLATAKNDYNDAISTANEDYSDAFAYAENIFQTEVKNAREGFSQLGRSVWVFKIEPIEEVRPYVSVNNALDALNVTVDRYLKPDLEANMSSFISDYAPGKVAQWGGNCFANAFSKVTSLLDQGTPGKWLRQGPDGFSEPPQMPTSPIGSGLSLYEHNWNVEGLSVTTKFTVPYSVPVNTGTALGLFHNPIETIESTALNSSVGISGNVNLFSGQQSNWNISFGGAFIYKFQNRQTTRGVSFQLLWRH